MIELILSNDHDAIMVALLSRLGIVFVSWIMIIAVCLVDFWAGVSAAKAEGTKLNSHGFRKTMVKIGDYFKVALVGMMIDIVGGFFSWYELPYATMLFSVFSIIIEGKSVFENVKRKRTGVEKVAILAKEILDCDNLEDALKLVTKLSDLKAVLAKFGKWKDSEDKPSDIYIG